MGQRGQVCSLIFIILQSVDGSNTYNFKDKGSSYITKELQALAWDRLFRRQKTVKVWQNSLCCTGASGPHAVQKKLPPKNLYRRKFLQSSFIFVLSVYVAKCNLGKVKLQANAVSGLLLKRTWSEGCPQGPFAYLVTYVASHAGIFELIFADLLLSKSLRILRRSGSRPPFKAPVPKLIYWRWV